MNELDRGKGHVMNRKVWDQLVSTAAVVIAVVMLFVGAAAIYGGNFGRQNVTDRLAPEKVAFPPYEAMSPEEQAAVGSFAGQDVTTGPQAEAFARYIQGHLAFINEGKTYSETSAAARVEGLDAKTAADLQAKADTLFKGETLRAILLNGYGWWTVATIALYAGWFMVFAGLALLVLGVFGFRHARKATVVVTHEPTTKPGYASVSA
jgi:hypothetical protein